MRGLLVLSLLWAAAQPLQAAEFRGQLSSLLAAREAARDEGGEASVPLYELVNLELSALSIPGTDSARLVMQGWGRLQLGDDTLKQNEADLNLLYLDAVRGPLRLRLGRQHLMAGLGRMRLLDGIDTRIRLPWALSAQAYFGAVVSPEFRYARNRWQSGGRIAKKLGTAGELGLAFAHERRDGLISREELGADGHYQRGPLRLLGRIVSNPRERALVEARVSTTWEMADSALLIVDLERVVPSLLLPSTSIFSVFTQSAHDAAGARAHWSINPYWDLDANLKVLWLDEAWLGYEAEARIVTFREEARRSRLGVEIRRLDETQNGYLRGRVFASLQPLAPLNLISDLHLYGFDRAINGTQHSVVGQFSAAYALSPSIRVVASVSGGSSPQRSAFVEGLVRLDYVPQTSFASLGNDNQHEAGAQP